MKEIRNKLAHEQCKLNHLVDEALDNGTPINETHELMMQCRKVHELILKRMTENDTNTQIK